MAKLKDKVKSRIQKTFKKLNCKECGEPVDKVDYQATAVTCWKCVIKLSNGKLKKSEAKRS